MVILKLVDRNGPVDSCQIPVSWNELNAKQLLYIASYWQAWQLLSKNGLDLTKARAKLLIQLISDKSKRRVRKFVHELSRFDPEKNEINPLSQTNFIFEKLDLTKNLLPEIRTGIFSRLFGPGDELNNISILEFSYILNFYNHFNNTGDHLHLDYMIACMYRPKKKNWESSGDIREDFNHNTADQHLAGIKKLSYEKKQAIYLFFSGCMYSWSLQFPLIFSRDGKETNKTFLDVILMMSGDVFGTFNETKNENAYLVLKELNARKEEELRKSKK